MEGADQAATTPQKWLALFLEGWRAGDAETILRSVADDFVYDDPVDGRFRGAEFATYLADLFGGDEPHPQAPHGAPFEDIAELVIGEVDGELTAWGWWTTASEEGAGLVKVGPHGVRSEKTAYYTLPAPT
jgi:hypothetical protein